MFKHISYSGLCFSTSDYLKLELIQWPFNYYFFYIWRTSDLIQLNFLFIIWWILTLPLMSCNVLRIGSSCSCIISHNIETFLNMVYQKSGMPLTLGSIGGLKSCPYLEDCMEVMGGILFRLRSLSWWCMLTNLIMILSVKGVWYFIM